MKKSSAKAQSDVEHDRNVGLEPRGSLSGMGEDEEKEGEFRKTRKRAYYDKEGHLLRRQGHRFRADHLKMYKIQAAIKGISQQELINKALEYYKENVLQKSQSQKLKEAGVGELEL